jgi:hypothetical protein
MKQTWTRDRDRLKLASSKVGIAQLAVIKKIYQKRKHINFWSRRKQGGRDSNKTSWALKF